MSLLDVLEDRGHTSPDDIAYEFVNGSREVRVTYRELHDRVLAIGATLQARGLTGQPVILLYRPGLEFVFAVLACLCSNVIPVPAAPPVNIPSQERLRSITLKTRAAAVLCTEETAWGDLPRVLTDRRDGVNFKRPSIKDRDLALLQFTSGSTGTPRGVMISHGNLQANLRMIAAAFAMNRETQGVIWLPPTHDMGLIGGILAPLFVGSPVALMSPLGFLKSPARWLELISRKQAAVSGAPNFAYALCTRRITDAEMEGLDLRSWRVAFCGAETVHAATLKAFLERFRPVGFREKAFFPCYGLAEATLLVSGGPAGQGPKLTDGIVSCGRLAESLNVRTVDGEIWVAGPSVAQGYWNDPEATAETFGGDGGFLRTGDLGFIEDGQLYITGRMKELIVMRGRNIHPHEVEEVVVRACPGGALHGVAAFSVTEGEEERLVLLVEGASSHFRETICSAVANALEVEVWDVAFVPRKALPRTPNGKLQRGECRALYLQGALKSATPSGDLTPLALAALPLDTREQLLTAWIKRAAASIRNIDVSLLDSSQRVQEIGLDSLQLVELKVQLDGVLGHSMDFNRFVENPSIRQLARLAAGAVDSPPQPAAMPGPMDSELLSNFADNPFELFRRLSREHPEAALFRLGGRRVVLLCDPDRVAEVVGPRQSDFLKGDMVGIVASAMGDGLQNTEATEAWQQQRRAAQPMFARSSIASSTERIVAAALEASRTWEGPVPLLKEMRHLALRITLMEVIGAPHFSRSRELAAVMGEIEDVIDIPLVIKALIRPAQEESHLSHISERLDGLIDALLLEPTAGTNYISMLRPVDTAGDIRHAVRAMLFAGFLTVSSGLQWTLLLLAQHPAALHRLLEELPAGTPSESILQDCPWLLAVICESLRLYPPIWLFTRQAAADTRIGPYHVERGTDVFISPWVLHRSPALFPDPDRFSPERFLIDAPLRVRGFIPFGVGRRACAGSAFALHEMAVVLATLLPRYRFTPQSLEDPALATTITLVPRQPVMFSVEAR